MQSDPRVLANNKKSPQNTRNWEGAVSTLAVPDTEAVPQVKTEAPLSADLGPSAIERYTEETALFSSLQIHIRPFEAEGQDASPWQGRVKLRCSLTPVGHGENNLTIIQVWYSTGHPAQTFPCSPSNQRCHQHKEGEMASAMQGC